MSWLCTAFGHQMYFDSADAAGPSTCRRCGHKEGGVVWPRPATPKCNSCTNDYDGTGGNGYQPCGCMSGMREVILDDGMEQLKDIAKELGGGHSESPSWPGFRLRCNKLFDQLSEYAGMLSIACEKNNINDIQKLGTYIFNSLS